MQEREELRQLLADALGGKHSRREILQRAAALGLTAPVFGALLAACGGGGDETPTTASGGSGSGGSQSTPGSGGAQPTQGTGASGGAEIPEQVVIMQGVDANTLDPLLRNATPEFNINVHVFDMFTKRNPKTLEVEPHIVTEWKNVDDLTWEFKLVEGAKFHNGDPVNADAAIYSFERAAKGKIGEQPVVQTITRLIGYESAEKVDEYTFRVKTSKPAAIFPDLLTSFEIVPPSVYTDADEATIAKVQREPVGSGPYKLVEWVKDDHIRLEAFEDYWGPKPKIKTVIFRPVPELSARVVALQNGEANIIVNVAPDLVPQLEQGENTRISQVTGGRIIFIGIRCDKQPFDDKRVRQALNYAVDWDSINTALLNGAGKRAATIVNPPHQNTKLQPYPYDPEKARALLKEAGVPEGFEVTMDAPSGRYIKDAEMAQAIAQNFNDIGLKINLRVLEWSVYAGELLPSKEPDPLFFLGLGSPFSGEQELFYVHPDYSLNYTRWQNADYVAKFAELSKTLDPTKRQQLMDELQEIIYDECPWVVLWHQVDFYGVTKNFPWEARPDERIFVGDVGI
ncbi:MAG: ABC transporter substrate-binding protein [Sphaerobacter sp.]|nr:ABC transporter substrate-binding protein [Sphaerobacter sp.]